MKKVALAAILASVFSSGHVLADDIDIAVLGMFSAPPTRELSDLMASTFDMRNSEFLSRADDDNVFYGRKGAPYRGKWSDHDVAVGMLIKGSVPGGHIVACDGGDNMRHATSANGCIKNSRVTSLSWSLPGMTKYSAVYGSRASIPSFFPNRMEYGGILVISSGNDGSWARSDGIQVTGGGTKVYVAAVGDDGKLTDYSNIADGQLMFAASGDLAASTGKVRVGTSFAGPRVAAALARIIAANPKLSNDEAIYHLKLASHEIEVKGNKVYAIDEVMVREVVAGIQGDPAIDDAHSGNVPAEIRNQICDSCQ